MSCKEKLDHPNIVNSVEILRDDNYIHFVTEICQGGELY
jgi:calcium-dependent protein kinase